ncbi:MAG: hypothetical protein OEY49_09735 [Candidatus Heimdallarchaeota archaeon]|nr:hypothetical protein [Candidatus Heimdallarchaeota archaeon]
MNGKLVCPECRKLSLLSFPENNSNYELKIFPSTDNQDILSSGIGTMIHEYHNGHTLIIEIPRNQISDDYFINDQIPPNLQLYIESLSKKILKFIDEDIERRIFIISEDKGWDRFIKLLYSYVLINDVANQMISTLKITSEEFRIAFHNLSVEKISEYRENILIDSNVLVVDGKCITVNKELVSNLQKSSTLVILVDSSNSDIVKDLPIKQINPILKEKDMNFLIVEANSLERIAILLLQILDV